MATTDSVRRTIIEGNIIKTVEERVIAQAPLEAALANIVTRTPAIVSNVPAGTRHLAVIPTPNGLDCFLVIEEYPQVRSIVYTSSLNTDKRELYRLALPYVYFAFRLSNKDNLGNGPWAMEGWWVFMNDRPIYSKNDKVLPLALPNTYKDGRSCTGNLNYQASEDKSLGGIVRYIVNMYWSSAFSSHVEIPFANDYKTLKDWEEATIKDEGCWTGWSQWGRRATEGISLDELFSGSLRFDAPIETTGAIPQLKMPLTYAEMETWLEKMPEKERDKLTAMLVGPQTIIIKAAHT